MKIIIYFQKGFSAKIIINPFFYKFHLPVPISYIKKVTPRSFILSLSLSLSLFLFFGLSLSLPMLAFTRLKINTYNNLHLLEQLV